MTTAHSAECPKTLADLEKSAIAQRPEARQAKLATSLAENQAASARSNLLPQVGLHGAFEADRQRFSLVEATTGWFRRAALEPVQRLQRQGADRGSRPALATQFGGRGTRGFRYPAPGPPGLRRSARATQRIEVAKASVAEAEESLRITQNRYEAGINNVTDLLRTETAVLEARTRQLAAIHDQRVAAAMLELAAGTLSVDSAVLNERRGTR